MNIPGWLRPLESEQHKRNRKELSDLRTALRDRVAALERSLHRSATEDDHREAINVQVGPVSDHRR